MIILIIQGPFGETETRVSIDGLLEEQVANLVANFPHPGIYEVYVEENDSLILFEDYIYVSPA